jgi:N,N'-diacetyllegionaminate synthase
MHKIPIIAEIGWNHCGDMNLAKLMIKAAAENGADYAKFQTWSISRLKPGSWDTDGRREIYEQAELTKDQHKELIDYCNQTGILFLSSVFSIEDAKLLVELNCDSVKIPSFESRNIDLIKYCNDNFQTVFMSTGTSTLDEIKYSIDFLDNVTLYLMHCVSVYPGSYKIANLPKMIELNKIHNLIGYSDHIEGIESAKIALGLGANVIEKHFTIDNNLPGRDNKFAILPSDLLQLRTYINHINDMMINHGVGFHELEQDSRTNYTGRFNG